MSKYYSENQLEMVANNCNQFAPVNNLQASMSTSNNISCSVCRNWNGKRCTINAFDNVVANLNIDNEE